VNARKGVPCERFEKHGASHGGGGRGADLRCHHVGGGTPPDLTSPDLTSNPANLSDASARIGRPGASSSDYVFLFPRYLWRHVHNSKD
jgi:hypothetical protein